MESDLPPTSYSVSEVVKNCISIAGLIQYAYAALAADAHACTTERRSWKKKSMSFPSTEDFKLVVSLQMQNALGIVVIDQIDE